MAMAERLMDFCTMDSLWRLNESQSLAEVPGHMNGLRITNFERIVPGVIEWSILKKSTVHST